VALAVESRLSAAFSSTEDEQLRDMLGRGIRALSERAAGSS
jgi:hypothetical protein